MLTHTTLTPSHIHEGMNGKTAKALIRVEKDGQPVQGWGSSGKGEMIIEVNTMRRYNGQWGTSFMTGVLQSHDGFETITTIPVGHDVNCFFPHPEIKRGTERTIMAAHMSAMEKLQTVLGEIEAKHPLLNK